MTSMAVITPSYAPDLPLLRRLHRTVLDRLPADVVHHVVVPDADLALFRPLTGDRCAVWPVSDLLPERYVPLPGLNAWVNVRRPWPPVRGWVMQQVVKLAAAVRAEAQCLLLVDSDVEIMRHVSASDVTSADGPHLYRRADAIDTSLPRHVAWHRTAERLLGLPPLPLPLPDYISPFNVWERGLVLGLRSRIEEVTGRPWADAVASSLHVSEFILYGRYADDAARVPPARRRDSVGCHAYWDEVPLDLASAGAFVAAAPDATIAVAISAKSGTPLAVREDVLDPLHRSGAATARAAEARGPGDRAAGP